MCRTRRRAVRHEPAGHGEDAQPESFGLVAGCCRGQGQAGARPASPGPGADRHPDPVLGYVVEGQIAQAVSFGGLRAIAILPVPGGKRGEVGRTWAAGR